MTGSGDRWLVLIGYMGAGKSTAGRAAAERLGRPFVDADAEIERSAGMAIAEIFSRKGELWFRRTEERVIRELLSRRPVGVLALGGGAAESARTRDLLRRTADVVWLAVEPSVAWARVEGSGRPLATGRERFERRAAAREPNYRDAAGVEVDASGAPDRVIEAIVAAAGGSA